MKTIGIFGGSFNPIHIGHVLAIHYVAATANFDEVRVIPCNVHPAGKSLIPFHHRFEMVQLAIGNLQKVIIDPIENQLPAPNYTIETLTELKKRRPANYRLIIGSDILFNTDLWGNDLEKIFKIAPPFILGRFGFDHPESDSPQIVPGVSSTEIRELLISSNADKKLSQLCPSLVLEYIKDHKLYEQ